jgi:hypothetical protein
LRILFLEFLGERNRLGLQFPVRAVGKPPVFCSVDFDPAPSVGLEFVSLDLKLFGNEVSRRHPSVRKPS